MIAGQHREVHRADTVDAARRSGYLWGTMQARSEVVRMAPRPQPTERADLSARHPSIHLPFRTSQADHPDRGEPAEERQLGQPLE